MKARLSPRAILGLGWLVFLLYGYPGYMNSESVDQLIDSRYGTFSDWHSPVMTEVWRIVWLLFSGPAGMLLLQSLLVLLGAYHLFRRVMADRTAALAASVLVLFPPVIAPLALICQESQLTAFLLAGMVALASPRRAVKLAGLVAIMLASGMRAGGALAALPIVVLGFVWRDGHRPLVRYALACAAWLAIAACAAGLNVVLVDLDSDRTEAALAELDIAGTVAKAPPIDDDRLRAVMFPMNAVAERDLQARIAERYRKGESILDREGRVFDPPLTEAGVARLEAARVTLALAEPAAYAAHRWRIFVRVLGLSPARHWNPVYTSFVQNRAHRIAVQHAARHSLLQNGLVWVVRVFAKTALFKPYVYLAIALLLLPLAIRRRQRDAAMLLASGIAYELTLFVVVIDPVFRYSHWLIVATLLAVVLMIARGRRRSDPLELGA